MHIRGHGCQHFGKRVRRMRGGMFVRAVAQSCNLVRLNLSGTSAMLRISDAARQADAARERNFIVAAAVLNCYVQRNRSHSTPFRLSMSSCFVYS